MSSVLDPSNNTSTTISDATVISTPNDGNIVVKGKHRLADDVNQNFIYIFFFSCYI
jgi:hypothetical protein